MQLTLADFEDLGNKQFRLVINTEEYRDYTVTETTKDIDGNSVTVSYKVTQDETESEGTGDSAAFSIEQGKTTKVDFEDDYEKIGTLELTKTIEGDLTAEEIAGELTFVVTTEVTEGETTVEKYLGKDGKLHDDEQTLTVGKDFTYNEETEKYVLTINDVAVGGYTVTETTVQPNGTFMTVAYKVGEDEETAGTEAQAEVTKGQKTIVEFSDAFEKITITVSKQDIAGAEIAGAQIQIKDKNGEVVEEWTSGTDGENEEGNLKPHVITGKLYVGEEYTLHEEAGPAGYTTVSDIKFEIGEGNEVTITEATTDGEVEVAEDGSIVITDKKTSVTVSKQDVGGVEIAGAKIQILDKDDNVVEEWTSGSDGENEDGTLKPHVIEGKLNVDEEYTLHEETAPGGYNTVTDFTFKVDNDNKVTLVSVETDGEVEVADNGSIGITDSRKEAVTVTVSKRDIAGAEIAGAQIQILD